MSEHKLNITWSEFAESSARSYRKLWMDEAFTDVILATSDDHQISSHKVILSSCSPFFRNILLRCNIILISDHHLATLPNILLFY